MPQVGELVCDADTPSEEQDGAVGVQGLVAAIRALDRATGVQDVVGGRDGGVIEGASEAGARAGDDGHGSAGSGAVEVHGVVRGVG